MKIHLSFLIFSVLLSFQALAQISPNPKEAEWYKAHEVYFDYNPFNEWIAATENQSLTESVQNLEALLLTTQSNYERMSICNTPYTEKRRFFSLKVSAPAQKTLVRFARKAMEEIDTFPFRNSLFGISEQRRKLVVEGLFHCVDFDFQVQLRNDREHGDLTRRYGDQSLQACVPQFSAIESSSDEAKARKLSALVSLYRLLLITGCSEIDLLSRNNDPEFLEDVQVLNGLIHRNVDLRRSAVGIQFKHWLKSLL